MELVKTSSIFISSPNYNRSKRIPNPRRRRGSGAMKAPTVCLGVSGSSGRKSPLAVSAGGKSAVAEKPTMGDFKVFDGMPAPLGAAARDGGVNFAICSSGASSATLCLFNLSDLKENRVTELIPLDPLTNKTGNIWHVFLEGEFEDMLYGYKFDGEFCCEDGHYFDDSRVLLDPYAKAVIGRAEYGVPGPGGNCWPQMACMIPLPDHKDYIMASKSRTMEEIDAGWRHGKCVDPNNKRNVQCNYCGKKMDGCVTRLKQHLGGITGSVA